MNVQLSKEDKEKLIVLMDRYTEQRTIIDKYSKQLKKLEDKIKKELDLLKQYRQEDFDFIDEVNKRYNIELTTEMILQIYNEK
jgi:hypothetical protein